MNTSMENVILREGQFFVDRASATATTLFYVGDGVTQLKDLKPVGMFPDLPPKDGQTYGMRDWSWIPQVLLDGNSNNEYPAIPNIGGGAGLASVGMVVPFFTAEPPDGWLECDGSQLSKADYSTLYNSLADVNANYIVDDETFLIPDLRNDFLRGKTGERAAGSWENDALQNMVYNMNFLRHGVVSAYTNYGPFRSSGTIGSQTAGQASPSNPSDIYLNFDASRIVRTADETRPRNTAVLYCIKY